jgi:hypothetical protein
MTNEGLELLIIILNKTECLKGIMDDLAEKGLTGATIFDSRGIAQSMADSHASYAFLGSLRSLLDPAHKESKTIFMVIEPKALPVISEIVNRQTGGLDKPDTGVMFCVPVSYSEGLVIG